MTLTEIPSVRRKRERAERKAERGKRHYRRGSRKTAHEKPALIELGFEKAAALRAPAVAIAKDRVVRERKARAQREAELEKAAA